MLCVLFSFFEVQKELNIIDSHSVPRPCFWWPSLAGSFLQSHRAGHSLLSHGPSLTAILLKENRNLLRLRGSPVVGSQMTSQWDISGPDLKAGSQKFVPHSRRGMSLAGDLDPDRGF